MADSNVRHGALRVLIITSPLGLLVWRAILGGRVPALKLHRVASSVDGSWSAAVLAGFSPSHCRCARKNTGRPNVSLRGAKPSQRFCAGHKAGARSHWNTERTGALVVIQPCDACVPRTRNVEDYAMMPVTIRTLCVAAVITASAAPSGAQESSIMTGEIVKVDEPAGKITIRIGAESKSTVGAGQAGTTEIFGVKDGLLFNAVTPGENIRFSVETINGEKRISRIEPRP
jgi:Cu/Ag efflux protein CusF